MSNKGLDWKDIANSQFSKALALAITILLFAFLIAPKGDVKVVTRRTEETVIVEAPPDQREKEETPQEQEIEIQLPANISEELASSTDVSLDASTLSALASFGDLLKTDVNVGGDSDRPFDFVPYEDAPQWITPPKPVYPDFAMRAGIQGTVWLEVDVYKDGSVGDIRVKKSVLGLDDAAIEAVRKIRFIPGKSGGNPVDTTVNVPVEFRLN